MTATAEAPRLGLRARRIALIAHIVSGGAWIGVDVVFAVAVATGLLTDDVATEALAFRALELVVLWPLLGAGLATLATGLVLGSGTRYGLVRWWWVAVKLVVNLVLVALVVVLLRPGIHHAAAYGEDLAARTPGDLDLSSVIMPPLVSGAALVFATTISVLKPWGRLRGRRP